MWKLAVVLLLLVDSSIVPCSGKKSKKDSEGGKNKGWFIVNSFEEKNK